MFKAYAFTVAAFCLGVATCSAQIDDPLHGCIIGTNCADNGTVTPTGSNPLPNFTFTISPGPQTGDFLVDILIPNDAKNAASLSFSISGTQGGPNDNSSIPSSSSTFKGNWTSGSLATFLGLTLGNGSPDNNITAWLPYTKAHGDSGATGYDVYQVDLGTNELQQTSGNPTAPILTLSGSSLPIASLLTGFLGSGSNGAYISTANSGALFEAADAPVVPEPSSLILFGSVAALGLAVFGKLRRPVRSRI